MARKLNTYVHAVEKDDKSNVTNSGTFGPDDDLSKPENGWVEKAITNPDVWEDDNNGAAIKGDAAPARKAAGRPTDQARP